MDLAQMQADVAEVNHTHGWYDEERTFGEEIALLHSEASEALEEYRKHFFHAWLAGSKPNGVGSELADVLIRLLDTAERLGVSLAASVAAEQSRCVVRPKFGDQIADLHAAISWLLIKWAEGVSNPELGHFLAGIFVYVAEISRFNNIDLEAEYARKFAYNQTRPWRHGGKKL